MFYGLVNPMGSCWAQSIYQTTHLLGRLCPLSSSPVCAHYNFARNWQLPFLTQQKEENEEDNWSRSALFVIKYANLYLQPGSSNLIGWKLDMGMASEFIQHGKG